MAQHVQPPDIQKFSQDEVPLWMEWSGISLADMLNEDDGPGIKLGAIGFLRAPKGAESTFEFVYDEALIVISGKCTVESQSGTVSATRGEIVYLPAGRPGRFRADEATELAYVASTPYGIANREARAALLADAESRREADDV